MSNKRKIKPNPQTRLTWSEPPEAINPDDNMSTEDLKRVLKQRPEHPDFATMAAAVQWNDHRIDAADEGDKHEAINKIIAEFCDPKSLVYMAAQRAIRSTDDFEDVKSIASGFIDGFLAACVCQDRAVIDMNEAEYESYERDDVQRHKQFDEFRRQSSDIFEFRVDRSRDDDRSFSKGSMEWLHDLLWLFLSARIAAHWDREGEPCRSVTINTQIQTDA